MCVLRLARSSECTRLTNSLRGVVLPPDSNQECSPRYHCAARDRHCAPTDLRFDSNEAKAGAAKKPQTGDRRSRAADLGPIGLGTSTAWMYLVHPHFGGDHRRAGRVDGTNSFGSDHIRPSQRHEASDELATSIIAAPQARSPVPTVHTFGSRTIHHRISRHVKVLVTSYPEIPGTTACGLDTGR
jgi:hypothetical protein